MDKELMDYLMRYDWPGNVREIENVVERIVSLGNGRTLTSDLLPQEITNISHLKEVDQTAGSSIRISSISQAREKKKQIFADMEQE